VESRYAVPGLAIVGCRGDGCMKMRVHEIR
jgi:hypothetical protein